MIGSPYCVRDYVVDARFGGPAALAAARAALAELGLKLILDYVPNHVAPDHPWAASRPELLVPGEPGDPVGSVEVGAGWVARGRDPYFPPWPDVVQLERVRAGAARGGRRHAARPRGRSATGCAATWRC